MAKQAGCSAIHLPYEHPDVKVSIPVAGEHPFFPETVGSIVQGILSRGILRRSASETRPDPWEQVGYRVFGPLFTGFLLWLASIAQERRPEKILLCARDCHFLWKNLGRFLSPAVETSLPVCLPRVAAAAQSDRFFVAEIVAFILRQGAPLRSHLFAKAGTGSRGAEPA